MTTDNLVARLKEICRKRDIEAFCGTYLPQYIQEPEKWLQIAREQREIENFRDRRLIQRIKEDTFPLLQDRDPGLFAMLAKHIDVCLMAQSVFDHIDQETGAVPSILPSVTKRCSS